MRALTIRQPWAGLTALGVKDIENRTWYPPDNLIGRRFAIHAGRTDDPGRGPHFNYDDTHDLCYTHGLVIATVKLAAVTIDADSQWAADGHWHWILEDPHILVRPIRAVGQRGLWHLTR